MPRSPRRSRLPAAGAALALALIGIAACAPATLERGGARQTPLEIYRALLGRNSGLTALRAVAETRISFGGRAVALPGVLLLDSFGGFRLELLDPLDRPLAILFAENGKIVQYRPGQRLAASLGVFPAACGGFDPGDWVAAVMASSLAPVAGDRLVDRGLWGRERSFERHRESGRSQSVRYRAENGELRPRLVSWYCGDEDVLQLHLREWVQGSGWRLPSRFDIDYPKAGLAVSIELREIEANPLATRQPMRPPLGADVRWSSWNLPQ